jgi:RNase P/RNase MRP subunit p30
MNRNVKFSHSLSRLLRGAVEFNLVSALLGQTNSGVFSRVSRAIAIAREHKVKVVLSSGAQHPDMIRSPLQISGLGSTLGLSTKEAAEGVSSIPLSIVAENLKKRSPEYIEEGVTIVIPSRR